MAITLSTAPTTASLAADKTLGMAVTMGTASASADCRPLSATVTRVR